MGTFSTAVGNAARSAFCSYLNGWSNWSNWFFSDPIFGNTDILAGARESIYRLVCDIEPPSPPPDRVPGGQCVTGYYVRVYDEIFSTIAGVEAWRNNILAIQAPSVAISGPITGLYESSDLRSLVVRTATSPAGDRVISSVGTSTTIRRHRNYRFLEITRADGLPDNCGSLPGTDPPTTPPTSTVNVTYNTQNNAIITLPVTFIYAPIRVGVNGTLNVPVSVRVNNELNPSFTLNINLSDGTVTTNPADNGDGVAPKVPQNEYDTPTDTPPTPPGVPDSTSLPPSTEPPASVSRIRGVVVTVPTAPPGQSVIFQTSNPDIYIPRLGNVQFLCNIGGVEAWTEDIPVRNRRQVIQCPWEGGAIKVRGTPAPGVTWTLSPIWAEFDEVATYSL